MTIVTGDGCGHFELRGNASNAPKIRIGTTGARVFDCNGLTLYPGLIEPFLPIDVPAPDPDAGSVHWNPVVLPQRSALDGEGPTAEERKTLRELGFLAAAVAPTGGVFKGTAAVVQLSDPEPSRKAEILNAAAYQLCSLQTRRLHALASTFDDGQVAQREQL